MVALSSPVFTIFRNGQVVSGGKIETFRSGTSTPLTTYQDADLTTPHANPIVADANGQAIIYLATTYNAKFAIKDASDALIQTIDPIYPGAFATGGSSGVAFLDALQTFSQAQRASITTLTSASASIAIDLSANNYFTHTLTENTTLANPTNVVAGQTGAIFFTQDSGTARTLAYGSHYKFPGGVTPSLTASTGAIDTLYYTVRSTTFIEANLVKGFA